MPALTPAKAMRFLESDGSILVEAVRTAELYWTNEVNLHRVNNEAQRAAFAHLIQIKHTSYKLSQLVLTV